VRCRGAPGPVGRVAEKKLRAAKSGKRHVGGGSTGDACARGRAGGVQEGGEEAAGGEKTPEGQKAMGST
jgi:hypothetical protein